MHEDDYITEDNDESINLPAVKTELALLAGGQETFSVNVNNLECNNT